MRQVQSQRAMAEVGGYCFGAIVGFEIAQRLDAHRARWSSSLAMFNGPSPAWIKEWGWYGNQPSWRAKHSLPTRPPEAVRRRRRLKRRLQEPLRAIKRAPRAISDPRRIVNALWWYTRKPRMRLELIGSRRCPNAIVRVLPRAPPEGRAGIRDHPLPGEILVFSGEDCTTICRSGGRGWRAAESSRSPRRASTATTAT